ncbi:MAG: N-acetylmuramoyl-L-alanine amidase [Candidatus Sulfotelmatobacter sp.]|jgi:N-acetylmuramoyl-L-alanine amidase
MLWNSNTAGSGARARAAALILFFLLSGLLAAAPGEKHLSVYSTAANYSLSIVQRQGHDYVGLLEVLDPLGSVSAKLEGSRWRIHYNNILGEFTADKTGARVQGRDADLSAKFLVEDGRGLVPVSSLSSLLPRFLGGPATFHEESDRLFIGSVATHFTASVAPDNSSHLVFHFTGPVNPSIASEPGKLQMTFSHDPVTSPASATLTFGSKTIRSATYSESNGAALITVATSTPLLASFSSDGRTITLAPAQSQAPGAVAANPPAKPTQNSAAAPLIPPAPSAPSTPRRYFAVVDASHGGSDRGEALSPTLAEKDVTLAFAHLLRQELESRGITTLILRDSDANLSLDDRASFANTTHAAIYLALHATSTGHGVRLYTAMIPYGESEDRGPFHSWQTAQSSSLSLSQLAAAGLADSLKKIEVPVRTLTAPLRPLTNVTTAAVAVEVAPPASDVSTLTSPDYQQLIAGALANGIFAMRQQLSGTP